ncbi:hypothetical protein ACG33_11165 [Steroidobacter denitrificans]|uniref:Translocation and assembly module subunit TamA n=1 Tax=Steroidobacter denitrificans TaxID=465721 RepID=A0A127FDF3_STEDE|nr:autotransporter assembly complex family protein [Steroidobacter denitrificans]AMN47649.1 hypothetical protein ACG33_11165 [Steroidobacter denitrificans]
MLDFFRFYNTRLAILLLAGTLEAQGAGIGVDIQGLPAELDAAARAGLELTQYIGRDPSPAQIHRLFIRGEEQIRKALEPYGYYQAQVRSELKAADGGLFRALFVVDAGAPVKVVQRDIRMSADSSAPDGANQGRTGAGFPAAQLPSVQAAIQAFEPGIGEILDHGLYEASKARIDAALRESGFLDVQLITHRVGVSRRDATADIDLEWATGERYRFSEVRFSPAQFREGFLERYIPWEEGDFYSADQLLVFQQRLVDADYFSSVGVQPVIEAAADGRVPVDVLVIPAKRTLYTAGVYMSTDTGPGVRFGIDRRWVNRKGHKFKADMEYSQRVQGIGTQYTIPRPGPDNRSYNFGAAYRDEETDSSRSRMLRLAANDSRDWRGFVRTLGLQYLAGDFEIADERHNSSLLFAEGVLSRKRADDFFFATRGYSLTFAARGALETLLADTSFAQISMDAKWIRRAGDKGRVIVHGGAGAMLVDDFGALPPELRFFTGGDRSVRGFDFKEIGEMNAAGGVIGGKFLAYAGAEYEHYFVPNWGAAVFADAGDAFDTDFDLNLGVGVGLRWKSPIGIVRLDVAKPVVTELGDGFRIHVIVGPDL